MNVGSLFSGVGGFDLGLERAGMSVKWQVEYDKHCKQVLAFRWPGAGLHSDVRNVGGDVSNTIGHDEHIIAQQTERSDLYDNASSQQSLFSGGSSSDTGWASAHPVSVGGEQRWRGGTDSLSDVEEDRTDESTSETGDGNDGSINRTVLPFIDLLCGGFPCQDLSLAGKRDGLAGQKSGLWHEFHRIIGELTPRWVLIENVSGLLSSNEGADLAVVLRGLEELGYGWAYRILDSQYFGVPQRRRRVFIVGCLGNQRAAFESLFPVGTSLPGDITPKRNQRKVAPTLFASGAGTERTASAGSEADFVNDLAQSTENRDGEAKGFHENLSACVTVEDKAKALRAGASASYQGVFQSDVAHTLTSRYGSGEDGTGRGVPIVTQVGDKQWPVDVAPTLDCAYADKMGLENQHALSGAGLFVPDIKIEAPSAESNESSTVMAGGARTRAAPIVTHASAGVTVNAPRRLTPLECERLQGFPDNWTLVDGMKDGARYRMMGNAVTVNVADWIGRQILRVNASLP